MDQSGIQAKINYGYGKAANYLGSSTVQYRPLSALNPLAAQVQTFLADFDIDPLFSHKAPAPYAKPLFYGLFDATYVQVGDYLVSSAGTFFVAAMEPSKPPLCVRCNVTISVLQANDNPPGPNYYSGDRRQISATLMAGWPASVLQGIRGEKGPVSLPGDVRMPWFNILVPSFPGVDLTSADQITDETGRALTIGSVELTPLGYRLTAQLADT